MAEGVDEVCRGRSYVEGAEDHEEDGVDEEGEVKRIPLCWEKNFCCWFRGGIGYDFDDD